MQLTDYVEYTTVNNRFPHIGKKINELWGTVELNDYLNELLTDTREGTRQGFPPEIASALFKLSMKHDVDFPDTKPTNDIWYLEERQRVIRAALKQSSLYKRPKDHQVLGL